MKASLHLLAGITLLLGSHRGTHDAAVAEPTPPAAFAKANVRFEQNATDGDMEVVFEVKTRAGGLNRLSITSPDGRTVVDFTAPDTSTLGMRQFIFESPEPKDVKSLQAAYPEGEYLFNGTTASGARLQGKSTLRHDLPATVSFVRPSAGSRGVAIKNLQITWTPVKEVAAYIVYIEQDELDVHVTAQITGTAVAFEVPDGFLAPATEYTLGIGTVSVEGNISYVETSFTTAGTE
ncbi:MAG: hypothetical protein DKINENOH_02784 [bacterium]|nr:hypothetical protein [bacterium]